MIFSYSKSILKQGKALINGKAYNYSFSDNAFSFVPVENFSKVQELKRMGPADLKKLTIICNPYGEENTVVDIVGVTNAYIPYNNNLQIKYDKLFIHKNLYSINAISFEGPSINQIVQNTTIRRLLMAGKKLSDYSVRTSFRIFGIRCDLTTITELCNASESEEIRYKSTVYVRFLSSINREQAFSFYLAFVRLVQFMCHRRDIYFDCDTYEIDGNSIVPSGSIYLSNISEAEIGKSVNSISLETILPVLGDLINFIIDGNIVPLFIPVKQEITFSDSYILATSWAQMVFKQAYVPANKTLTIKGFHVYDNSSGIKREIHFCDQLALMIKESFSSVSNFPIVSLHFILSKIDIEKYISEDLPKRLKKVRDAIAHGSTNEKDYEYTRHDMLLLMISIYHGILKKKFGLSDSRFKLAIAELFFDDTTTFGQWTKTYKDFYESLSSE